MNSLGESAENNRGPAEFCADWRFNQHSQASWNTELSLVNFLKSVLSHFAFCILAQNEKGPVTFFSLTKQNKKTNQPHSKNTANKRKCFVN